MDFFCLPGLVLDVMQEESFFSEHYIRGRDVADT